MNHIAHVETKKKKKLKTLEAVNFHNETFYVDPFVFSCWCVQMFQRECVRTAQSERKSFIWDSIPHRKLIVHIIMYASQQSVNWIIIICVAISLSLFFQALAFMKSSENSKGNRKLVEQMPGGLCDTHVHTHTRTHSRARARIHKHQMHRDTITRASLKTTKKTPKNRIRTLRLTHSLSHTSRSTIN